MDVSIRWNGGRINAGIRAGAQMGLNRAAEHLLTESKVIIPVDTGDLRRSGHVQETRGIELSAWVVYNVAYAVTVHEGVAMNFSKVKNPLAQAKFLETPLQRDKGILAQIVAADIRRVMGGAV